MAMPLMAAMLVPATSQAQTEERRAYIQRILDSSYYDATKNAQGKLHFSIPLRYDYGFFYYSSLTNGHIYYNGNGNSNVL